MSDKLPLKAEDLDGHHAIFGYDFSYGGSNGIVSIYFEDDGFWYKQASFDVSWLPEYKNIIDGALEDWSERVKLLK